MVIRQLRLVLTSVLVLSTMSGCQRAYYSAMESLGVHKRDIFTDRVEAARDAQIEAKDQFASALEAFQALVDIKDDDLEETYAKVNAEYEQSQAKATAVRERIDAVEGVAGALFDEWEAELDQYTNKTLRQESAKTLTRTQDQYRQLIEAMHRAEKRMDPVLNTFRDQVLVLKHSLNARAIASLDKELRTIEADVTRLIQEMDQSINEANTFIRAMASA